MQTKRYQVSKREHEPFHLLIARAKQGDSNAMEKIMFIFEDEIQYLASFQRMPREEAVQILKVELLSIINDTK